MLDESRFPDGAETYRTAYLQALEFPPDLTVSQWADQRRKLTTVSSSKSGDWRTDRVPQMRAVMDFLSDNDPRTEGVLMTATQQGKSEVILNGIGYTIDYSPGPAMGVLSTQKLSKKFSKQRVKPMIEASPALSSKVAKARARDSGNTTEVKEFKGGFLVLVGANSPSDLKSMPVRRAFCDEVDEYPEDLDDQGSVLDLVRARQSTFRRRKLFITSSPTVKGASLIEKEYESGTKEHFHVPCPHCGHMHELVFENLNDDGRMVCPQCAALITEALHKTAMLAGGVWVAEHPERTKPSWQLSALYTPIGLGDTWPELAKMQAEALGDPVKMKAFTNMKKGLPYEGQSEKVEANELRKLRQPDFPARTIPEGCLILVRSIDVQADRFEVTTLGFGRAGRHWIIEHLVIPGDPLKDWEGLDEYTFEPITNAHGEEMPIRLVGIDSGNWSNEVYQWVRRQTGKGKRVIALKGSKDRECQALATPRRMDVDAQGKTLAHGVKVWMVGVHAIKDALFQILRADLKPEAESRFHFPHDLPDSYFDQLASERKDLQANRWVKLTTHSRNEALDCLVYGIALAYHPSIRAQNMRESDWAALESRYEPGIPDRPEPKPEAPKPAPTPNAEAKPEPARKPTQPLMPRTRGDWDERGFT